MNARAVRSMVVAATVAALVLLGTAPAMAHEFQVVLVEGDSETAADAVRGFRLAVDQSPDVSHPPGEESGDHLGGVDVDILTVQAESPTVADDVATHLEAGASAVLVMADGQSAAGTAIAPATARSKLVLALDSNKSAEAARGHIVLRPGPQPEERRMAGFVAAFTEVTGTSPTDAAALGYDAGTLLDALVRDAGHDLAPGPALAAARAAADQLAFASLDIAADPRPSATALVEADSDRRLRAVPIMTALAIGSLVIGAAAVAIRRTRRGSTRPSHESAQRGYGD